MRRMPIGNRNTGRENVVSRLICQLVARRTPFMLTCSRCCHLAGLALVCVFASILASAQAPSPLHRGYYTAPAIHGDTLVFTSEGDLWTVGAQGGIAHRLTSDPGSETNAVISPDGKTVAFSGDSQGPMEVYSMPIEGGLPQRRTWDGDAHSVGFAPDGRLMISTTRYSTLPSNELVLIDDRGDRQLVPLAQAAEAVYDTSGHSLFFTRWYSQPSHTKRYKGGTAESIWRFDAPAWKLFRLPPTIQEPPPIPCSGMAVSTSFPTATAFATSIQ